MEVAGFKSTCSHWQNDHTNGHMCNHVRGGVKPFLSPSEENALTVPGYIAHAACAPIPSTHNVPSSSAE